MKLSAEDILGSCELFSTDWTDHWWIKFCTSAYWMMCFDATCLLMMITVCIMSCRGNVLNTLTWESWSAVYILQFKDSLKTQRSITLLIYIQYVFFFFPTEKCRIYYNVCYFSFLKSNSWTQDVSYVISGSFKFPHHSCVSFIPGHDWLQTCEI